MLLNNAAAGLAVCFLLGTVAPFVSGGHHGNYSNLDPVVTLRKRSTLYLPHTYSAEGVGKAAMFGGAVEQLAYDSEEKIVYTAGNTVLHAVDVSDPNNMRVLHYIEVPDVEMADVEVDGNFVFVAIDDKADKSRGRAAVYSRYTRETRRMDKMLEVRVGGPPDMVKPLMKLKKLLVVVSGEAYEVPSAPGTITDPPGTVVMVTFPNGITSGHGSYGVHHVGFKAYSNLTSEMRERGVRHVFRNNGNPFYNDVEPENIALARGGTRAYVTLQENNAVAVMDTVLERVLAIHGLGYKNWMESGLDASDRDGGAYIRQQPIYGIYQPDGIHHVTWKGEEYLILANEGDAKEYKFMDWSEVKRGADFTDSELAPSIDNITRSKLLNPASLGRLEFSTSDGKDSQGRFESLYTFGGRSWSIRRADDLSLVWDSGSDVARRMRDARQEIFNAHINNLSHVPADDADARSDDKGQEPEAVAVGEDNGVLLIFIANERPGTILVYSLKPGDDINEPVFQDYYDGIAETNRSTWQQLYDKGQLSEIDCEDIKFVPAKDSPTGRPILLAGGTVTGTVSIIDVTVIPVQIPTSSSMRSSGSFTELVLVSVIFIFICLTS